VTDEEEPIIVDLDEAVFEVLRRVETSTDPSAWIRAAVQEKAEREDRSTSHDVAAQLNGLRAEMVRLVELEQEFAVDAAIRPLSHLSARLRELEGLINQLGPILDVDEDTPIS
jgi:hypothetical protein